MEELQSTEVLDREILDDARKKALRILKQAEDTIHVQNEEWEKKTNGSIKELEKKINEQKKTEAEKITARLPIDKLRIKVEKTEKALNDALTIWYEKLDRKQILELLSCDLKNKLSYCKDSSLAEQALIKIHGLDKKEAETILKNLNINSSFEIYDGSPSITLETRDIRITSSLKTIMDFPLDKKRYELVKILVGHDFTEEC